MTEQEKKDTDAEKHLRRVAAICKWIGWEKEDRRGIDCWRHFVPGKDDKMIALHEPVATWDPWRFREDLYWVLKAVREKGLCGKLAKSWLSLGECLPETLVGFSLERPAAVMELVWELAVLKKGKKR